MLFQEWKNASADCRHRITEAINQLIYQENTPGLIQACSQNPYAFFPSTVHRTSGESVILSLLQMGSASFIYSFFLQCPATLQLPCVPSHRTGILSHSLPSSSIEQITPDFERAKNASGEEVPNPDQPYAVFEALCKELSHGLPNMSGLDSSNMTALLRGLLDNPQADRTVFSTVGKLLIQSQLGHTIRTRQPWGELHPQDTSFWAQAWLDSAMDADQRYQSGSQVIAAHDKKELKDAWMEQVFFVIRKSYQHLLYHINYKDPGFYSDPTDFYPSMPEIENDLSDQIKLLWETRDYALSQKWLPPAYFNDFSLLTDTLLRDSDLAHRMDGKALQAGTLQTLGHLFTHLPMDALDSIKQHWTMDSAYASLLESHILQKTTASVTPSLPSDGPSHRQKPLSL